VVTQNVDGLHQRAGLCDSLVSELHGSVFRETCDNSECEVTEIKRTFDVTSGKPHNGRHRHKTGRACDSCGSDLKDVVVHFGERLRDDVLKKARQVCLESTLSVVMGTSLKIPPANTLPRLSERRVICNLQWTAQDKTAAMKINAKCDDVMLAVCKHLDVQVPVYDPVKDAVAREVKKVKEQSSTKAEFAPLSKKQRSAKNPSMPRTTA
jgi:NAD-dependent SIR2 family protein deacetylase